MHLDQLRRQAKELRDAARQGDQESLDRVIRVLHRLDEPVSLAQAQFTLARELGFASWPKLKEAAVAGGPGLAEFLELSLEGPAGMARSRLRGTPEVAESLFGAAVLGEADRVGAAVAVEGPLVDQASGWTPLLYAAYSRWHQFDAIRGLDWLAQ